MLRFDDLADHLLQPALQAVLVALQFESYGVAQIGLRQILLASGIYLIDWLLFPVILLRLAPLLQREALSREGSRVPLERARRSVPADACGPAAR